MPTVETIVATATPPGRGAIAVVRLSGPAADGILARLSGAPAPPPRCLRRAILRRPGGSDAGGFIDDALVVRFPAPKSYTGEDVVELHLHGGPLVVREALDAVLACGARAAQPGEFTLRAFLNGRMDLVQVEGVAGIIDAMSPAALEAAGRQVSGRAGDFLGVLQDRLRDLLVRLEADLDFPEDVPELPRNRLAADLGELGRRLAKLAGSFDASAAIRRGLRVVLAGPPNVGKSALFNALVGHPRALVTGEPGTTRDYLEETVLLERTPVVLVDTAGLREAVGAAEREGVRRTHEQLEQADLVLRVVDRSDPAGAPDAPAGPEEILVLNKADLPAAEGWPEALDGDPGVQVVSAKTGDGLDGLIRAITARLEHRMPRMEADDLWLVSVRQRDGVARAAALLEGAAEGVPSLPEEIIAGEIHAALDALAGVTGRRYDDHVLDRIFEDFCIGK
ncbi:MAG: tRNA uridine-5-carboxymethylaminomethyl(34) synthesis GTPase MnmE [Pseudomonadota bacterium]